MFINSRSTRQHKLEAGIESWQFWIKSVPKVHKHITGKEVKTKPSLLPWFQRHDSMQHAKAEKKKTIVNWEWSYSSCSEILVHQDQSSSLSSQCIKWLYIASHKLAGVTCWLFKQGPTLGGLSVQLLQWSDTCYFTNLQAYLHNTRTPQKT